MTGLGHGDEVVARYDLGGGLFGGEHVPGGARGVVIDAPMFGAATVRFKVEGGFWSSDRIVEKVVGDEDVL